MCSNLNSQLGRDVADFTIAMENFVARRRQAGDDPAKIRETIIELQVDVIDEAFEDVPADPGLLSDAYEDEVYEPLLEDWGGEDGDWRWLTDRLLDTADYE